MDNSKKLYLNLLVGLIIYIILTLPMIIAIFNIDNNGEYNIGYVYPQWLTNTVGVISGISSIFVTKYIIKKIEERK